MSHNAYYEVYLHVTWRTKGSAAVLRGNIEREVHEFIGRRIRETEGVYIHAIGGTDDHVHLAVHIAPTVEIAKWIGDLKGACSHHVNQAVGQKLLYWQNGYGVVSFGKRNLDFVVEYIRRQRDHHAKGDVIDRLERTEMADG